MFRIRQSSREDVEQIFAVAEHLDTVNLPADRGHLERILELSEQSFSESVPVADREYLFVLEDLAKQRVIGTSMIHAQHGTRRAPHIFFRVENPRDPAAHLPPAGGDLDNRLAVVGQPAARDRWRGRTGGLRRGEQERERERMRSA